MPNLPDTNQDSELFELCKEVYERFPEWETNEGFRDTLLKDSVILGKTFPRPNQHRINHEDKDLGTYDVCPLYTSDYLLEKLPREIRNQTIEVVAYGDHWEAAYSEARDALWDTAIKSHAADTPLKALLKLTIALHKEGLLV